MNDKGQSAITVMIMKSQHPGWGKIFLNFMCKRVEEVLINMGCEIPTTTDMKILMHVYMGIGKMFRLLESLVTKQFCYFPWP